MSAAARDVEAAAVAAESWLTTVELCGGLPEPEQIAGLIERGRHLPLSQDGATALVELELLHSWLIEHFGGNYTKHSSIPHEDDTESA